MLCVRFEDALDFYPFYTVGRMLSEFSCLFARKLTNCTVYCASGWQFLPQSLQLQLFGGFGWVIQQRECAGFRGNSSFCNVCLLLSLSIVVLSFPSLLLFNSFSTTRLEIGRVPKRKRLMQFQLLLFRVKSIVS